MDRANQLQVASNISPVELFASSQSLDDVLNAVEKEVMSHAVDMGTATGRKNIASLAYKVSQTKVALDAMGKSLVQEWKEKSKRVDNERKRMRKRLDILRDKVRRPLTEYEEAEQRRIASHKAELDKIESLARSTSSEWKHVPLDEFNKAIECLNALSTRWWDEFGDKADAAIAKAIVAIKHAQTTRREYDAEQAELLRLRAEDEERKEREKAERIARDAAEAERREAERRAVEEREKHEMERIKLEKDKLEAELRAERAESERIKAIETKERELKEALELAERQRREEQEREAALVDKLRRDEMHRLNIRQEIIRDACACCGLLVDLDAVNMSELLDAIEDGKIPRLSIDWSEPTEAT